MSSLFFWAAEMRESRFSKKSGAMRMGLPMWMSLFGVSLRPSSSINISS